MLFLLDYIVILLTKIKFISFIIFAFNSELDAVPKEHAILDYFYN